MLKMIQFKLLDSGKYGSNRKDDLSFSPNILRMKTVIGMMRIFYFNTYQYVKQLQQ